MPSAEERSRELKELSRMSQPELIKAHIEAQLEAGRFQQRVIDIEITIIEKSKSREREIRQEVPGIPSLRNGAGVPEVEDQYAREQAGQPERAFNTARREERLLTATPQDLEIERARIQKSANNLAIDQITGTRTAEKETIDWRIDTFNRATEQRSDIKPIKSEAVYTEAAGYAQERKENAERLVQGWQHRPPASQMDRKEIIAETRTLHEHYEVLAERYQEAPPAQRAEIREEMKPIVARERELRQEFTGRMNPELTQDRVPTQEVGLSR